MQEWFCKLNLEYFPVAWTYHWQSSRNSPSLKNCFPVCPLTRSRRSRTLADMSSNTYGVDYDGVIKTMQLYIDGCKQGDSELMRPAFHADAGFFGYVDGDLALGTPVLFQWVDKNGSSPNIRPRFVSVDILESIASVRLEVDGWSGALAGPQVCMSDIFTLLKTKEEWKIIQKAFHWRT